MLTTPLPNAPSRKAPGPAAPGFRIRLRAATRCEHDRVEAAFERFDLARRDGLAGFLAAQALSLAIVREGLEVFPWSERIDRMLGLIESDLATLRRPLPHLPAGASPGAHPLGPVYVIAGSRLGAAILRGRLRHADDPLVRQARRYLSWRLPRGAWARVCADLDAIVDPDEARAVMAGARRTFGVFERAALQIAGEVDG